MLTKPFGTPWTFTYKPQVGGEYVTPSGDPSIYVFEARPSEEAARAGTGAVATISSWTYTAALKRATFTVPAIADPQDGRRSEVYYVAINFTLSGGNQAQCDIRSFELAIPDGMDEDPVPTATELKGYDSTIGDEYEDTELDIFIANAERSIKRRLKWKGKDWPQVENPGDLFDALIYRALMFAYIDLADESNDVWIRKHEAAKNELATILDSIVLQVDVDDDNEISPDEKKTQKIVRFIR